MGEPLYKSYCLLKKKPFFLDTIWEIVFGRIVGLNVILEVFKFIGKSEVKDKLSANILPNSVKVKTVQCIIR